MATMNPLEQKARSSFIKGFVIAILIGIIVSGLLGYKIYFMNKEAKEKEARIVQVSVLSQDVKSGQVITDNMFKSLSVDRDMVPKDAAKPSDISKYYLADSDGNKVTTADDGQGNSYPAYQAADGTLYEVLSEVDASGKTVYYYQPTGQDKIKLDLTNQPYIAKIDLKKNSIITPSMFTASEESSTDDQRTITFSMISLPIDLEDGDTVDIRLRLTSGADYIVLAKKKVSVPKTGDGYAPSAIQLQLSEGEILTMNAAIVDAYRIEGCKFYALKYTDPGMQAAATLTYVPSQTIIALVEKDPNIVKEAHNALINNYNANYSTARKAFDESLAEVDQDKQHSSVVSGTNSEISSDKSLRQSYLSSVSDSDSTN